MGVRSGDVRVGVFLNDDESDLGWLAGPIRWMDGWS